MLVIAFWKVTIVLFLNQVEKAGGGIWLIRFSRVLGANLLTLIMRYGFLPFPEELVKVGTEDTSSKTARHLRRSVLPV